MLPVTSSRHGAPLLALLLLSSAAFAGSEPLVFANGFEAVQNTACVEKSVQSSFNFPSANGQTAGALVTSACLRLVDIAGTLTLDEPYRGAQFRINGGDWVDPPITVANNDEVEIRANAPGVIDDTNWVYLYDGGNAIADFLIRTRNDERAPMTLQVGPGRTYTELTQVADLLRAGDIVEVDGNHSYAPVEFQRAGLPASPITIRGIRVSGQRPEIAGGTITVSFRGAHHYVFENIDVTGGSEVCVRNEANDVTIRDSHVHDCTRHGILGADNYSGSLTIDRVEVDHAGGVFNGENLKHPIYIATDRDRYPGSRLRVQHSYIHDYGGNGIKSRSERDEIYYNWIDTGTRINGDVYYTIELNGYEEYESVPGINVDVVGNVLVHRNVYGVRLGGDGTGNLRGRVRFVHNTLIVGPSFDQYTPLIRWFDSLESAYLANNVFARIGGDTAPLRIQRDDAAWVNGSIAVAGTNNWVPSGSDSIAAGYFPDDWTGTVFGSSNPGYANLSGFDSLNLTVQAASDIDGAAGSDLDGPSGYEISNPMAPLDFIAPATAPVSGSPLSATPRVGPADNIGAR
ncbi:MAG: hypothetical protein R3F22_10385 [Lysobacteraceae bacterium]